MRKGGFLIVDFEFTCWRGRPPKGMTQEILEIGLVEIDLTSEKIIKKDSFLIKPENSNISNFCTKLTSITVEDVESFGISLNEAFSILEENYRLSEKCWGSWGSFDKTHLSKECKLKGIDFPFSKNYINVQKSFSKEKKNKNRLYSVENALKDLGIEFEGIPHRAEDDAYNTAIICLNICKL
jgi:inhibitor of KinA sporulation pathway (predicted exonuclease)